MVFKKKRKIGSSIHPQYKFFTEGLVNNVNFNSVDPDISAIKVIEKCTAVISMPFTSTAIIARDMGKPSIYYDPDGIILKDDPGSHGIPIITGINELKLWVNSL